MDHEKSHYRRDENGVVRYDPEGNGEAASLQHRTAVGRHKDGSVYLRAADSDDLTKIKDAADAMGVNYRQRRGGASHFGRIGSYEHLHFDHPQDAVTVHAALGYHLEEDGKPVDHDGHLKKLSGGMAHHVQGKDARVDACMLNTRKSHEMSLEAGKSDTPDSHRSAAQLHRLSAEAHRAQASRPWTKGEGAHHAGLAILHENIAKHHDDKAVAAHKRIQAEIRRQAELKAKMEAMEKGREVKKAHIQAHTRTVNGKLVQVREYDDNRPTHSGKADPEALTFREHDQNRTGEVAEMFPDENYHPVVTKHGNAGYEIIDGHNRTRIAMDRGHQIPFVSIDDSNYDYLRGEGYDDMEIAYATLAMEGERDAAEALDSQFSGAGIGGRGEEAVYDLRERMKGRETKKALVHQHTRTVNGKLVVVHEHQDSRSAAKQIEESTQPGPPTYKKAVAENLKHMGTGAHEWEAVPIKGMRVVDTDTGSKTVPEIEWPKGYDSAPSLYSGDVSPCCELCGTPIKNIYGLQHHGKKWTLRVGSECVTHFGQGQSGEQLLKKSQQDANKEMFQRVMSIRKTIESEYTTGNYKVRLAKKMGKPIPAFQEWTKMEAYKAWKVLYDMTATSSGKDYNAESAQAMTGWVGANKDKVADAISKVESFLGRTFQKAHVEGDNYVMGLDEAITEHQELVHTLETPSKEDDKKELEEQGGELEAMREAKLELFDPSKPNSGHGHIYPRPDGIRMRCTGTMRCKSCQEDARRKEMFAKNLGTCGAGDTLSTLKGGGALRAEGHDEEISDATMGRETMKAGLAFVNQDLPEPTPAQAEAGNYKKHHVTIHGLHIAIENPKGSIRRGVDGDGHEWESKMAHHYGYIKRTEGADWDHVDVFVGPEPENPYVHVINQIEPTTGKFDEHKCMMGFASRESAIAGYHANYQDGWKGCDEVRTMHVEDFKHWLKNGDTTSRLIYKAAATRLHSAARVEMQRLRVHPGSRMSCGFIDAVESAKSAGITNAEILRTVSNATGVFAPLVKHLKENA